MERLVHISQLGREGRVTNVEQVVNRGDTVKAKVLSASGCNISLREAFQSKKQRNFGIRHLGGEGGASKNQKSPKFQLGKVQN